MSSSPELGDLISRLSKVNQVNKQAAPKKGSEIRQKFMYSLKSSAKPTRRIQLFIKENGSADYEMYSKKMVSAVLALRSNNLLTNKEQSRLTTSVRSALVYILTEDTSHEDLNTLSNLVKAIHQL